MISDKELCTVCFNNDTVLRKEFIKAKDTRYYKFLKTFNLLGICYNCFKESIELYKKDINDFLDWLDENDNRPDEDEETSIERLRKPFNVTEQLLIKDPDKYIENISKYVLYLEHLLEDSNATIHKS